MAGLFSSQPLNSPSSNLYEEDTRQVDTARLLQSYTPAYLADLSLAEMVHEERQLEEPTACRPRTLALLIAANPEIERLGLLAAINASLANAIAAADDRQGASIQPRQLLRYFPSMSSKFILAASRLRRRAPLATTSQRLDDFHVAMDTASQAVVALAASAFDVSLSASGETASLASLWRRACISAHALLIAIEDDLANFLIERNRAPATPLLAVLADAADGGTPLLTAAGEVVVPAWFEARRAPRISVDCAAVLQLRGERHDGTLIDISTGGAGLRCGAPMVVGERVTVVVGQSIAMSGVVVWRTGKLAGIEFDQPFFDLGPEMQFLTKLREPFTEA